jgi:large subunit ribosomal protein L17
MVTSLMLHGRIKTTEAKAKEVRRLAEKIITLGKRVPPSSLESLSGDELAKAKAARLHAIRQARKTVNHKEALEKVFNEFSERYKSRPGGYTRIYKLGFRPGDNAPMNIIELVTEPCVPKGQEVPVAEVTEPDDSEAADDSPAVEDTEVEDTEVEDTEDEPTAD